MRKAVVVVVEVLTKLWRLPLVLQKELEAVGSPIIQRLYEQAGGGAQMPGSGPAGAGGSGPTVEEVD